MKRDVDQRKTRKALRKLRRAADRATEEGGPGLSDWEQDFVEGVTTRLEAYGSAFRDPGKGRLDEALSVRQAHITRLIDKKSRKARPAQAAPAATQDGEPARTSQQRTSSAKPEAQPKAQPKARSSFKPKARADWKPRGRDINDEPASTGPAPKKPTLKIIRGGKR
jgi:hypothetical protein